MTQVFVLTHVFGEVSGDDALNLVVGVFADKAKAKARAEANYLEIFGDEDPMEWETFSDGSEQLSFGDDVFWRVEAQPVQK